MSSTQKRADFKLGFKNITQSSELSRESLNQRGKLAARAADLGGIEMMRAYSDLTDALVRRILDIAIEELEVVHPSIRRKASRGIAIAAVGGYGRCEMSPFSDVDVAFLVGADEDEDIDQVIKRAFRILMDVIEMAGLKVGYSYRKVDQAENLELETQTALLDARCIAGSVSLFDTFHSALKKAIVPAAFVTSHIKARNGSGTPFVVEPDIKEGHGGLRDLHTTRWIAQVSFCLSNENVWDGLRSRGILLDEEIDGVHSAAEFISRTRNELHLLTQRGQDVLTTSRQDEVAQCMWFSDTKKFISLYYWCAHQLWRVYKKVASACLQADLEIEPGVLARDTRLHILDRGLLQRDRAALIRIFRHTLSFNLQIDREASDLITASARGYELTSEAGHIFLDILSNSGAASTLRLMAEMGVLEAIIPEFGELMYLIPGDAAHQYTVGEHSLRAVEQLESLLAEDNEQFIDVFSRVQHFEVLFLAMLLHDVGKLDSKKDHVITGATRASKFAAELGMPDEACSKVAFLVKHHLKMSETARLRDLHQTKTIEDFAAVVIDLQLLDMLFLLTVADYRAVGARHWSQVQIRFLSELHERTAAALRSPGSVGADLDRHKNRVRRELCLVNLPPDEVEEHCASLPASYLLNTPPEELAAHIGYIRTVRDGYPAVEIKDDRAGEFTQLTVVALDKPGLLSEIAGVLHAMNIDVHAAQIFTRHSTDEIAIDTLYIDYEGRQLMEMKKWQLEGDLLSVLNGELTVDDLLRRWAKKKFEKPDEILVIVLDNLSDHQTVLEIRCEDKPGLLNYLTHKISELGLNIHSARVATWGYEARDVFYVTNSSGVKLNVEQISKLHAALNTIE